MKFSDLETSTQIILKVFLRFWLCGFCGRLRDIILVLILSLILASAMDPMVNYFKVRKVPRTVSVLTVYILVLGLVGLFSYLLIPVIVEQFKIFIANLPQYINSLQERFGNSAGAFSVSDFLQQQLAAMTNGNVVCSTFGIFDGFVAIISVLVISFYLVAEEQGMKSFIGILIPPQHREFTVNLVEKVQKKMGLWILGQVIVSFINVCDHLGRVSYFTCALCS